MSYKKIPDNEMIILKAQDLMVRFILDEKSDEIKKEGNKTLKRSFSFDGSFITIH